MAVLDSVVRVVPTQAYDTMSAVDWSRHAALLDDEGFLRITLDGCVVRSADRPGKNATMPGGKMLDNLRASVRLPRRSPTSSSHTYTSTTSGGMLSRISACSPRDISLPCGRLGLLHQRWPDGCTREAGRDGAGYGVLEWHNDIGSWLRRYRRAWAHAGVVDRGAVRRRAIADVNAVDACTAVHDPLELVCQRHRRPNAAVGVDRDAVGWSGQPLGGDPPVE